MADPSKHRESLCAAKATSLLIALGPSQQWRDLLQSTLELVWQDGFGMGLDAALEAVRNNKETPDAGR